MKITDVKMIFLQKHLFLFIDRCFNLIFGWEAYSWGIAGISNEIREIICKIMHLVCLKDRFPEFSDPIKADDDL